jgi:hypothetical protein
MVIVVVIACHLPRWIQVVTYAKEGEVVWAAVVAVVWWFGLVFYGLSCVNRGLVVCVSYWAGKESWWKGLSNGGWESPDEIHFLINFDWSLGVGVYNSVTTRKMAYKYVAVFNSEGNYGTYRSHEGNPFFGSDGTVVWNGRFFVKGNCTVICCSSIRNWKCIRKCKLLSINLGRTVMDEWQQKVQMA